MQALPEVLLYLLQ
jgi:hypothetical protein